MPHGSMQAPWVSLPAWVGRKQACLWYVRSQVNSEFGLLTGGSDHPSSEGRGSRSHLPGPRFGEGGAKDDTANANQCNVK